MEKNIVLIEKPIAEIREQRVQAAIICPYCGKDNCGEVTFQQKKEYSRLRRTHTLSFSERTKEVKNTPFRVVDTDFYYISCYCSRCEAKWRSYIYKGALTKKQRAKIFNRTKSTDFDLDTYQKNYRKKS